MNTEYNPLDQMDPALEQAMLDIREDSVDPAVVEAAAARVWANLAAQCHAPLHSCADFQAALPDFKAGSLPSARALLVRDHLHECVACRRVYEGRVVSMPPAAAPRPVNHTVRWAVAATVLLTAGLSVWFAVDQYGNHTGRAIVQAVNGTLYEILPTGIQVLAAGQEFPDGVEVRTSKDSNAMLQLKDGSVVELRERSGFSTSQTTRDLTIRLDRGSIIVQAAKRSSGHLYVATADCRVAVTGTVFSVTSGVKGSRVSVIEGEVHVSQDSKEKVLHPGDQTVTSPTLDPISVQDDINWSRNREKLTQQLETLRAGLATIQMPQLRYSSKLLGRLPASTVFFASIPNLSDYLGQTQVVFDRKMSESPELRAWWGSHAANVGPIIDKLRAASEYLGDEIVVTGFTTGDKNYGLPVFFAESKRPGFADFVKQQQLPSAVAVEERNGLVAFGPREALVAFAAALDTPSSGFEKTPFYARIEESYRSGAGILLAGDLAALGNRGPMAMTGGARYFIAEEKEINNQMEARASIGFDGPRSGMAAWLAAPSPMGSLDYISSEATIVSAFVVKSPTAIVDGLVGLQNGGVASNADRSLAEVQEKTGVDVRNDLALALGGEFSLSLDGALIPVPSWKLVTEVYDPVKLQAALQKFAEAYSRETVKAGNAPLRISQEVFEGRTYYMIAGGDGSPLTEAHYTFADGYLIAGPSRALIARALQVKSGRASIAKSAAFTALLPRDHYNNFSALMYQNLGTSLSPLLSLFGGMIPQGRGAQAAGQTAMMQNLSNLKSTMIAAYGEPDRITVATSGNLMGLSLSSLITGDLRNAVPFTQFMGTTRRAPAFK
ncbi:MAG: FecR domain-containing protein [Candidatus Solibacter sp.]